MGISPSEIQEFQSNRLGVSEIAKNCPTYIGIIHDQTKSPEQCVGESTKPVRLASMFAWRNTRLFHDPKRLWGGACLYNVMHTGPKPPNGIKSLNTAFDIVEYVYNSDGATLSDISEGVGVTKSTVHCHLATMIDRGYIRENDGRYHLGLLFLNLGIKARENNVHTKVIQSGVRRVADEIGEKVQFVVEEFGRGYFLFTERGKHGIHTGRQVGRPIPLHDNAAGKAILAEFPDERVRGIIDHWGLSKTTKVTITDADALFEELDDVRSTGIAYNRGESREDLGAIGCAISRENEVIGAISVAGPKNRIFAEQREQIEEDLLALANEIKLNFD